MSKAIRLNELRLYINRVKKFKVDDLAKEFNVSRRTILRDLEELSILGVPLISEVGANGGYRVLEERNLLAVSFTKEETLSIFFALLSLKHFISLPFESEYQSIIRKFYLNLNGKMKEEIDLIKNKIDFKIDNQSKESPLLKELFMAAIENESLWISYLGVKREIQPVGLFSQYGRWYCPSYCYLRKDFRLFRCDRISEVELSDRRDNLNLKETSLHEMITMLQTKKKYDLKVELTPIGVEKYKSNVSLYYKLTIDSKGYGVMNGSISETEIDFLSDYFIQMGNHAKVVEPVELKAEIKRKILILSDLYSE
ncbi:YafY family transcriptional regulator [Niallia circulans]|uniref:helix-turn-helix transcriptional regulator n=1 Tax=Niallia TaxID=2837506 RepID=UPI00077C3F67|nr:YafY family protein [Niallia circulans]MDR4315468.1 YafY family transcriptional regulator [Niallia circulans]MED3837287.1 YafY family protein [Niallia circulans]MED4244358.1 YafY family protein [Niallia circulans]MED4248909.1 YafY family protein [Niallia circulans]PAD89759.1 YafY family transcriptional regulator [Niallia circulans]